MITQGAFLTFQPLASASPPAFSRRTRAVRVCTAALAILDRLYVIEKLEDVRYSSLSLNPWCRNPGVLLDALSLFSWRP